MFLCLLTKLYSTLNINTHLWNLWGLLIDSTKQLFLQRLSDLINFQLFYVLFYTEVFPSILYEIKYLLWRTSLVCMQLFAYNRYLIVFFRYETVPGTFTRKYLNLKFDIFWVEPGLMLPLIRGLVLGASFTFNGCCLYIALSRALLTGVRTDLGIFIQN